MNVLKFKLLYFQLSWLTRKKNSNFKIKNQKESRAQVKLTMCYLLRPDIYIVSTCTKPYFVIGKLKIIKKPAKHSTYTQEINDVACVSVVHKRNSKIGKRSKKNKTDLLFIFVCDVVVYKGRMNIKLFNVYTTYSISYV